VAVVVAEPAVAVAAVAVAVEDINRQILGDRF
jgi:hypothetical protein